MSSYVRAFGGFGAACQALDAFKFAYEAYYEESCPAQPGDLSGAICKVFVPLFTTAGIALTHNAAAECIPPTSDTQRVIRFISSSASFIAASFTLYDIGSSSLPSALFKAAIAAGSIVNGVHLLSQGWYSQDKPGRSS